MGKVGRLAAAAVVANVTPFVTVVAASVSYMLLLSPFPRAYS